MDSVTDRNRSDGWFQWTYECSFSIWSEGCISNFQTDDERNYEICHIQGSQGRLQDVKKRKKMQERHQSDFEFSQRVYTAKGASCADSCRTAVIISSTNDIFLVYQIVRSHRHSIFDIWCWIIYNSWQRERNLLNSESKWNRKRQQRHVNWKHRSRISESSSKDNFVITKTTMSSSRRQSRDDSNDTLHLSDPI